jgi:hypothetical protein
VQHGLFHILVQRLGGGFLPANYLNPHCPPFQACACISIYDGTSIEGHYT